MFEISKVNVHRGVFEWAFDGVMPTALGWIGRLGPLRIRLLAVCLGLVAVLLTFQPLLAQWLYSSFGVTSDWAVRIHIIVKWSFAGLAALVWLCAFLFRKPYAVLVMNRPQGIVQLQEQSMWSVAPKKELSYRFQDVEKIEVFSSEREPKTPQGYVKMIFRSKEQKPERYQLNFRFLTQEQFEFFPTNLYKIIGKEPQGDWSEDEAPSQPNPS